MSSSKTCASITSVALYEHSCAASDAGERLETLKPALRPAKEEYEEQWRAPFPEREMTELTGRVKEMKGHVGKSKAV